MRTKWVPEIQEYQPNIPFLLVGTQTDLRGSVVDITECCVRTREGRKMAKRLGAEKYIECSSLEGIGLHEVFQTALAVAKGPIKKKKVWRSFKRLFKRKSVAA